jgi:hypothetical protein
MELLSTRLTNIIKVPVVCFFCILSFIDVSFIFFAIKEDFGFFLFLLFFLLFFVINIVYFVKVKMIKFDSNNIYIEGLLKKEILPICNIIEVNFSFFLGYFIKLSDKSNKRIVLFIPNFLTAQIKIFNPIIRNNNLDKMDSIEKLKHIIKKV